MSLTTSQEDVRYLVENLNFKEKVERSLGLIERAWRIHGDRLVVANSLGKDSVAVWHLARQVNPDIRGFIVTTRFKPPETKRFMAEEIARYPKLQVFENIAPIPPAALRNRAEPLLRYPEGRADASGYQRDGRHVLGHRTALHGGPHAHGLP